MDVCDEKDVADNGNQQDDQMCMCQHEASSVDSDTDDEVTSELAGRELNPEAILSALNRLAIANGLSHSIVRTLGYRPFTSKLCPQPFFPSSLDVLRHRCQIYVEDKLKLKEYFKNPQRICLTLDTWSSIHEIIHVSITAHFIDSDWKFTKKMLNFYPIPSLDGDDVAEAIELCLLDWGIKNIFTITVKDAGSNDVLYANLKRIFANWGCIILHTKSLFVRCIAHTVNLVVDDTLKELGPLISRVRGAVECLWQSSSFDKFEEYVEHERIPGKNEVSLDDTRKWDSTFMMLDIAQNCERAFERLWEHDSDYRNKLEMGDGIPSEDDWANVRRLVKVLKLFHDFLLRMSCSQRVTANTFFNEIVSICCILQQWKKSEDMGMRVMAGRIKEQYDKHWGSCEDMNVLIYVAVVLDPRYKLQFLEFSLSQMYEGDEALVMGTKVREATYNFYNEYKALIAQQYNGASEKAQTSNSSLVDPDQSDAKRMKLDFAARFQKYKAEIAGACSKSELDVYLSEVVVEDNDKFDILQWWKLRSSQFPVLSSMACDVLAVPISAAASETVFSIGGGILNEYKSLLHYRTLQAFMCAQDWLRASFDSPNYEKDIKGLDKLENDLEKTEVEPTFKIVPNL